VISNGRRVLSDTAIRLSVYLSVRRAVGTRVYNARQCEHYYRALANSANRNDFAVFFLNSFSHNKTVLLSLAKQPAKYFLLGEFLSFYDIIADFSVGKLKLVYWLINVYKFSVLFSILNVQ